MDAESLLNCWDQGRRRHPIDRALLLYAAAVRAEDPETLADRPLGERNAALLRMRQELFGDALKSCVECPQCGERLEFSLSAEMLLARAGEPECAESHVLVNGSRVRRPTTRDLACIAREPDGSGAASKLLARLCATDMTLPYDEVARALDAADPCLDLGIDLACPQCAHPWTAALDVPAFLWEEIEVRARRLLDEVHLLARSYHWREADILRLSETRRRAYLDRVLA